MATIYHVHGRTQHEIADELGASRPTVSRLLREAREAGIVRISVSAPPGLAIALESELEERFGLRAARVVPSALGAPLVWRRREIGAAAATDLARSVQPGQRIALASGGLLAAMVAAMAPMTTGGVRVVQAVGWGAESAATPSPMDLVERLARRIGGAAVVLPAPAVVANEATRRGLGADPHIAAALHALDALDTAYVEIGCAGDAAAAPLGPGRRASPESAAPVGHIALRWFDRSGVLLRTALDSRVVGITAGQLRRVRHVVALVSAPADPALVAAALRTGIVRTLITDELTARALAALPEPAA